MDKKKLLAGGAGLLLAAVLYIVKDGHLVSWILGLAVIYLVTFKILLSVSGKNVKVQLKVHPDEADGCCSHVKILVKNEGILPILNCSIKMRAENLITGSKDCCSWNIAAGPKSEKSLQFDVRDELCGAIKMTTEETVLKDFFGIMSKSVEISDRSAAINNKEAFAYIYPQLQEIPISSEDMNRYDMESFKYSASKKGNDSSETFGISVYKPGDSIKSIHWKLSGKMDDIVVRELGLPIENKLMVLVDKSDNGHEDFDGAQKSRATQLAASLAWTLARMGIHHHIGWYDARRKEFECFKVKEEADIWGYMQLLLASPFYEGGDSAAVKFIEAEVEKDFSNFVLVSNDEVDIERLMNYGEVNIYRPEDFE